MNDMNLKRQNERLQMPSLVLVAVGLLLTACPKRVPSFGALGEPKSADELLARIAATENAVYSVESLGKLFADTPEGKGSVGLFVAALHADKLHVEQLDFFNQPQRLLKTDGQVFVLYEIAEQRQLRGKPTVENMARFLPIALPVGELVGVLLGRIPRIPHDSADMRFDSVTNTFQLTLKHGAVTQVLDVATPSYRVEKSTVTGVNAYDVECTQGQDEKGQSFCQRVKIIAGNRKTTLEVILPEAKVNGTVDLTLFDTTPADGVKIMEL
jgi:hypothetical protein